MPRLLEIFAHVEFELEGGLCLLLCLRGFAVAGRVGRVVVGGQSESGVEVDEIEVDARIGVELDAIDGERRVEAARHLHRAHHVLALARPLRPVIHEELDLLHLEVERTVNKNNKHTHTQ